MPETLDLRVDPATAATPALLAVRCARELHIGKDRIARVDITRRSIDARQRNVVVNLTVKVHIDTVDEEAVAFVPVEYRPVAGTRQAIVVGAGPAGLFAALELIEAGIRPIVLERGKDVDSRRRDMVAINRTGTVDPDSNYCFGEGGAGAYSDGKLYTRSKKRGPVDKVLKILHQHGAQSEILVDAHPHIGTDRLPAVIKAIRETIIASGGEVHFGTKVTGLLMSDSRVNGVITADGHEWRGPVILATGHSARDVYHMLADSGITIEPKGIAVGVRLEHPQELIDRIQYHSPKGRGKYLPAAEYSMLTRVDDRAVYSFCMCPGGYVVNASSEPGRLCVNGMSYSDRNAENSNSAIVVNVTPDDFSSNHPLAGMYFQRKWEELAYQAGNGSIPVQRFDDFRMNRTTKKLGEIQPSIKGKYVLSNLNCCLPEYIKDAIIDGVLAFDRVIPGFAAKDAVLSGIEARTSSPIRIDRDADYLSGQSSIYPCGEGAGYAGGITSAAVDGMKVFEAIVRRYQPSFQD